MRLSLRVIVVAGAVLCAAGASAVAFPPIRIAVTEPDSLARRGWPLTFSVPLPRGLVSDAKAIAAVDEKGAGLPTQTRVLARWPDGSVRWLLLDTQIDLAARQTKQLRVLPGKPKAPAARLVVDERGDRIAIDTGAARFAVPRTRFAIVEALQAGETSVPAPLGAVLVRDGERSPARPPRRVSVTESGPLRARVEIEGDYGNGFDYVVRLDAYAGQPFVRVHHTFIARHGEPTSRVSDLALAWPVALVEPTTYLAGIEGGSPASGPLSAAGVRIDQIDNLAYRNSTADTPGRLAGWFALRTGNNVVGVAARWFWQQYPQGFSLTPSGLTYHLWSPEASPAVVGMGAAKTHELVVWAGGATLTDPAWAASVAQPLVGRPEPAWTASTGALPQAIAPGSVTDAFIEAVGRGFDRYQARNDQERWDDRGAESCDGWMGERPRSGAYGMWHWGDWNFPGYHDNTKGCDAWGNLEYDTPHVLALAFAATARADVFDAMVVAARHFMDVDIIHFQARRPEWVGMNHPKNPLHFSFELGGVDLGHTWTEGLLSYYYLTGDDRGLAAARGIADYLVRRVRGTIVMANPRQLGWPQVALLAVHEATAEAVYLEAARAYAERSLKAYAAEDGKHWKHGILADALAYTHAATRDERLQRWLRAYADEIVRRPSAGDPRLWPGVAYVARTTGDAKLRAAALAVANRLDLGGWGKPFTINGRLGFRMYSLLAQGAPAAPALPQGKPARAKRR